MLVYRYTEYRDTGLNGTGIDTGIALVSTAVFGIGNSEVISVTHCAICDLMFSW